MTAPAQSTLAHWRREHQERCDNDEEYQIDVLFLKGKIEGGEEIAALKGKS